MGQRGTNPDDPVRAPVPLETLSPWPVLTPTTDGRLILTCAECGWEVTEDGLWPDRDVHKPAQVGKWCSRCGRRWRYAQHPNSRKAILEHNSKNGWNETTRPTPEVEVARLPARLPQEVLPASGKSLAGRKREPRVMDKMRELQEEIAEDMVRPFKVALSLRPDTETDDEGKPLYDTPQLLKLLHSQARMAERLMDRTIGTPVARNANLNVEASLTPGKDVSLRAVDETLVDLINGDLDLPSE